jgi:hemoglobin
MRRWSLMGLLLSGMWSGCASTTPAEAPPSLYRRLGGREAIAQVVSTFVANAVADDRIKTRFTSLPGPAVEKLKSNLADQICEATGGPCSYIGRSMKDAHTGMKITEAEWTATVEDLVKALNTHKVGAKEQQELLSALGPMKKDIVGQ